MSYLMYHGNQEFIGIQVMINSDLVAFSAKGMTVISQLTQPVFRNMKVNIMFDDPF